MLLSAAAAQAGRAYRDIHFADSFDTVANKIFKDEAFLNGFVPVSRSLGMAKSPREWLSWGMQVNTIIGGDRYLVDFDFYDDKLYRITFTGGAYSASYFDTALMDLRDNLVKVITGAHGSPSHTRETSLLGMSAGYVTWSHIWDTNAEGTSYRIGLAQSGFSYYPVLSIEWTWMSELVAGLDAQSADDQIRQSQDDF